MVGVSSTLYAAGAIFLVITLAVIAVPSIRNFTGTPQDELLQTVVPGPGTATEP